MELTSSSLERARIALEELRATLRTATMKSSLAESADEYGISKEDQKLFGFDKVTELGRGVVNLISEPGEAGRARTLLTDSYSVDLEFKDTRRPYVIVRTKLLGGSPEKSMLENTVFLEKDKPSVLGLTNLKEAVVLISTLRDAP